MKPIIKLLIFMLAVVLFSQCEKDKDIETNLNAPYFTIVDSVFFDALIDLGIDTNGDDLISSEEARKVDTIILSHYAFCYDMDGNSSCNIHGSIASLEGIEAFSNLTVLRCCNNNITSIDLAGNSALTTLDIACNQITCLDLTNNTALVELLCGSNQIKNLDISLLSDLNYLGCDNNQLTSLDLSNNSTLIALNCSRNRLTNLDVSKNVFLEYLHCWENELTTLDVSDNFEIISLFISGNPSLTKVCVWTMPFPPEGVEVITTGSPNAYFTTDCSK